MPKFIVASAFTNSGNAKASGKPYSMTRALILVPFNNVSNANFQSVGNGFTAVEISVDSNFATSFQNQFNASYKGTPIQMDLSTSMDRETRTVITGFETATKAA
ncbi:MAG TPA: hypothetical protein VIF37_01480 [Methylobacter sp.]|jgi:hypothetical protein